MLLILGTTTGPTCVITCAGVPNGDYQSCLGCDVFVSCKREYMKDNIPCPPDNGTKTYWDDILNPLTSRPGCIPGSRYTGVGVLFFVI